MSLSDRDRQVVSHLLEHCADVADDVQYIGTIELLTADARTQRSLICSILQIGKLVKEELLSEFKKRYVEQPWDAIIAMRHKLVHHYAKRKLAIIWDTATISIPKLQEGLIEIISNADNPSAKKVRNPQNAFRLGGVTVSTGRTNDDKHEEIVDNLLKRRQNNEMPRLSLTWRRP